MIFMGSMQVNIPLRSLDPSYRHGWPLSKKRVFHWREKASQATERVSNLNPSQNGELRRYCQVSITGRSKMGIQVFLHPWKMGIFQRFQLSFRGVYDGCWWLSLVGILGLTFWELMILWQYDWMPRVLLLLLHAKTNHFENLPLQSRLHKTYSWKRLPKRILQTTHTHKHALFWMEGPQQKACILLYCCVVPVDKQSNLTFQLGRMSHERT